MSNRLESLNAKKAARPALKFKPKAVARKSKEDREKEAPAVKSEEPPRSAPTRGRGGSRGRGRGRGGAYVGTHLVSSGPLAMGSVSMGGAATKTGLSHDRIYGTDSSHSDPLAHLKLASRKSKSATPDGEADSDDDATSINMGKEYAFDESEVVLFPVRPHKDAAAAATPAPVELARPSRAPTAESVKSEALDEVAPNEVAPAPAGPDDALETAEHDRHIDDQRHIVDMLAAQLGGLKTDALPAHQYFVMHLPQMVPQAAAESETRTPFASPAVQTAAGQVGSLNFHKLGKITLRVGGMALEATGGVPSSFLQEVVVLDSHDAKRQADDDAVMLDADGAKIGGNIFRLGEVVSKIVATPVV